MTYDNMSAMSKVLMWIGLAAIVLSLPIGVHGCYKDLIADKLDEDCFACRVYRYTKADDTAFQLRESRRAERANHVKH